MTAADLMAELGKFPPYCPVILEVAQGCGALQSGEDTGDVIEWFFVDEVRMESNVSSIGTVVKIIAEDA